MYCEVKRWDQPLLLILKTFCKRNHAHDWKYFIYDYYMKHFEILKYGKIFENKLIPVFHLVNRLVYMQFSVFTFLSLVNGFVWFLQK